MRVRRLSLCIAIAAIALPFPAAAAPAAPGTTLKQAVESAWQRAPAVRTLQARQHEEAATRADARSWLAASPVVGLSQRSDQGGSEREQRESEISLASPVWLPGQKSARETLAERSSEEVSAQLAVSRLAVAGEVRERFWKAAAAQVTLSEQQDHLHHLEGLAEEVQRRVEAGDLARSDGLLARQELLAAQIEVSNARTRAAETLAHYRALTGLSRLPALDPEPLHDAATAANPRLNASRATQERAQAALRVASASRVGPPTIALSVRREDERTLRKPSSSIGVALQIPLGIGTRNRLAEAQAQTVIATAAAEAAEAQALIEAEIGAAQERLANARAALETARARASAMHEHTALLEKAFRLGERGLAELLRSQALRHEADIAVRQQQVALGLAHAQLNQALGIVP